MSEVKPQIDRPNDSTTIKEIEYDGYKFSVDTDDLDNVDTLELIERIENKNQIGVIIPLLKLLITDEGYDKMKDHFVTNYGKFRATALVEVYQAIIAKYDPKG